MPVKVEKATIWDTLWSKRKTPDEPSLGECSDPWERIRWLLRHATKETQPGQKPTIVPWDTAAGVLCNQIKEAVCPGAKYGNRSASGDILLCAEVSDEALDYSRSFSKSFFLTPNDHAKSFLDQLKRYHQAARVEVFYDEERFRKNGDRGFLLGICGYPKPFTLSFTMPVKNERIDVERVLASFRGVADEVVIGIDDTSSDETEEIVRRYADEVFHFTWQKDFSHARNECIDHCTSDWIFMSEGHEHLRCGSQALLQLDEVPTYIKTVKVRRETRTNFWYFPWLFRRELGADGKCRIRFQNKAHNVLVGYDEEREEAETCQIGTWHERSLQRAYERSLQRAGMNKQEFLKRIREGKA
jgi:hypothetical protein